MVKLINAIDAGFYADIIFTAAAAIFFMLFCSTTLFLGSVILGHGYFGIGIGFSVGLVLYIIILVAFHHWVKKITQ